MGPAPSTRGSLIVRLRDPKDADAWRQFIDLYGSLIYNFSRKKGLQDADAADLMQEVLRSVAGAAGRLNYDPRRGSFRGWLYTITRNKVFTFLSRRRHQHRGTGDTATNELLNSLPEQDPEESGEWERDYEQRLFRRAAEQIESEFRQNTWQAFWRTAVDGQSSEEAAKALQMSVGAVYVAKSRVLARLRDRVHELQGE